MWTSCTAQHARKRHAHCLNNQGCCIFTLTCQLVKVGFRCTIADAGIVLPVFEFEPPPAPQHASAGTPRRPLRDHTRCAYKGAHAPPRELANTFWAEGPSGQHAFTYTAQQLPVTDALRPWVPAAAHIATADGEPALFKGEGASDARATALRRFHLTQPFGNTLAVFKYPRDMEGPARAGAAARRAHLALAAQFGGTGACAEGAAAAKACCA